MTHNSILSRTGCVSIECMIAERQLRWTGHLIRMDDSRLPKQTLYGEFAVVQRLRGGQKKRFKDGLKTTLKKCHIIPEQVEVLARDRTAWRQLCKTGFDRLEQDRRAHRDDLRQRRHTAAPTQNIPPNTLACHLCPLVCRSRIGLVSHLRMHERRGTGRHRRRTTLSKQVSKQQRTNCTQKTTRIPNHNNA